MLEKIAKEISNELVLRLKERDIRFEKVQMKESLHAWDGEGNARQKHYSIKIEYVSDVKPLVVKTTSTSDILLHVKQKYPKKLFVKFLGVEGNKRTCEVINYECEGEKINIILEDLQTGATLYEPWDSDRLSGGNETQEEERDRLEKEFPIGSFVNYAESDKSLVRVCSVMDYVYPKNPMDPMRIQLKDIITNTIIFCAQDSDHIIEKNVTRAKSNAFNILTSEFKVDERVIYQSEKNDLVQAKIIGHDVNDSGFFIKLQRMDDKEIFFSHPKHCFPLKDKDGKLQNVFKAYFKPCNSHDLTVEQVTQTFSIGKKILKKNNEILSVVDVLDKIQGIYILARDVEAKLHEVQLKDVVGVSFCEGEIDND